MKSTNSSTTYASNFTHLDRLSSRTHVRVYIFRSYANLAHFISINPDRTRIRWTRYYYEIRNSGGFYKPVIIYDADFSPSTGSRGEREEEIIQNDVSPRSTTLQRNFFYLEDIFLRKWPSFLETEERKDQASNTARADGRNGLFLCVSRIVHE